MFVVRETFTAKPGKASALASLFKQVMPELAKDVKVLMTAKVGEVIEPVAWVREKDGRRVFYTSLGTPDDFQDPNFVRLLTNGLAWATQTALPPPK